MIAVAGRSAATSTASTMSDQSGAAIDAEYGLLPSRYRVLRLVALSRADALVDDAAARRAMANRYVLASMIEVIARNASHELSHYEDSFSGFSTTALGER